MPTTKTGIKTTQRFSLSLLPAHLRNELGVDVSEAVDPGPGLGSVPVLRLEAALLTEAPPVTEAGPSMGAAHVTHGHPGSSRPAIKTKSKLTLKVAEESESDGW